MHSAQYFVDFRLTCEPSAQDLGQIIFFIEFFATSANFVLNHMVERGYEPSGTYCAPEPDHYRRECVAARQKKILFIVRRASVLERVKKIFCC